jgi:hypothetical protein
MAPQIARGLRVALIKKTTDESGLGAAMSCGTVENMTFAVVDVFDRWEWLEENVYWCVPLLLESS